MFFNKTSIFSLQDPNKKNAKTFVSTYSLHAAAILTDIDCGRTAFETIRRGKNREENEDPDFSQVDASYEL